MSKILAVFGATGQQGGSIINFVLNNPSLSSQFSIRAITRDVNSAKAKQLSPKVTLIQGDVTDSASLIPALEGVHTVFAMTTPSFGPLAVETEFAAGKAIADACLASKVSYLIFSTLPSITALSGGKYTKVTPFDAKAQIETYIRSLPIKSAFFAGGFFMENFHAQPFLNPIKKDDGTYVLARPASPKTLLPYLDATRDAGKFIGAILAEPERFEGKTVHAAEGLYSFEDIAAILERTSGKKVVFEQIGREAFEEGLPPFIAGLFADGICGLDEFGYFGKETEQLVRVGREGVKGELRGLEEFLKESPVVLE
ncbi:hypothetical protein BKA65DRAFT_532344 [Rhexocercosporidium sp. MPI-PUGE-AT-0058]|nr:hypothetical protein BKA65DRAFT_532344 [Rhexocercosporidium sp. MPI-PUGE-AT-0058]